MTRETSPYEVSTSDFCRALVGGDDPPVPLVGADPRTCPLWLPRPHHLLTWGRAVTPHVTPHATAHARPPDGG